VWPKRFPCPWYIRCKPCTYLAPRLTHLQTDQNELPLHPHHLGVLSGTPKMISEPIARLAKIVQQLCVEINTISERTKTSFHLTHATRRSIGCGQNDFPCPWYIRRKPCTKLGPRLTSSPNGLKRPSTSPT
jgi:hypothetical protein